MLRTFFLISLLSAAAASASRNAAYKSPTFRRPTFPPTYVMSESTIVMPCNDSGYFDTTITSKFGHVDFDWSNGKAQWANAKPMNCEESLVIQAAMVKAVNPKTKVWVYRNYVKALPWYTHVYSKLADPQYSGWFLPFGPPTVNGTSWHVPKCDNNYNPPLCSDSYHDQDQTPQHPKGDGSCVDKCDCGGVSCGEYLWDHR